METIHVQLTIGRLILSEALTTILPSVLIVIVKKSQFVSGFISFYNCFFQVSFSTNFYGKDHFEAITTVNVTTLLVMMTLFVSVYNR